MRWAFLINSLRHGKHLSRGNPSGKGLEISFSRLIVALWVKIASRHEKVSENGADPWT